MPKKGPIILIEDDVDDQELISEAIRSLAYQNEIKSFDNGQEALEYLATTSDKPFLIFCDVNMPVMNGLELRKHINDDEYLRNKSIPFVFLSTSDDKDPVRKAYALASQGFFKKPNSL